MRLAKLVNSIQHMYLWCMEMIFHILRLIKVMSWWTISLPRCKAIKMWLSVTVLLMTIWRVSKPMGEAHASNGMCIKMTSFHTWLTKTSIGQVITAHSHSSKRLCDSSLTTQTQLLSFRLLPLLATTKKPNIETKLLNSWLPRLWIIITMLSPAHTLLLLKKVTWNLWIMLITHTIKAENFYQI